MHLCLAREAPGRRLIAAFAVLALAGACGRPSGEPSMSVTLDPPVPRVGTATTVRIALRGPDGQPLPAASVRVEAHMTHPGMTPVLPEAVPAGAGEYVAPIRFSMAGDWLIVVSGELPAGERFTLQAPVIGVTPASP